MAKRASSSSTSSSTAASAVKKAKVNTKAVVTQKPTTSGKKNVKVESKASTNKANSSKVQASKAKKAKTAKKKWTKPLMKDVYDFELKEYTVERIVDKRIEMDGFVQYFVKWLGYPEEKGTWKFVHELTNSMKHVLEWEREQGTNWRLPDYSDPDKSEQQNRDFTLMRRSEIFDNHVNLTNGNYYIKEKYGRANRHTWYLVETKTKLNKTTKVKPQVLCLSDNDPFHFSLSDEEHQIVSGRGAWDYKFQCKTSA